MGLNDTTVAQVLLRERVRITAAVVGILRDVHAADDIFQQVVLKALEGRDQFREPEHLLAWSLRAARHRAIDAVQKRDARYLDHGVLELLEEDWARAPAEEPSHRLEALHRCMDKLPEPARELLRLRDEDGLRCNAVASRLGRSVDAIYQSLSRVHRQLRQCVEQQLEAV